MFETIKLRMIDHLLALRLANEERDKVRSAINYGGLSALAMVMIDLGHDVNITVWSDKGMPVVEGVSIDGQSI